MAKKTPRPRRQATRPAAKAKPERDPAVSCTDCGWVGPASAYRAGFKSDDGTEHDKPNACPQCSGASVRPVADLKREEDIRQGRA
jgi:hypothetical protein